jgi:hypothetical protein
MRREERVARTYRGRFDHLGRKRAWALFLFSVAVSTFGMVYGKELTGLFRGTAAVTAIYMGGTVAVTGAAAYLSGFYPDISRSVKRDVLSLIVLILVAATSFAPIDDNSPERRLAGIALLAAHLVAIQVGTLALRSRPRDE